MELMSVGGIEGRPSAGLPGLVSTAESFEAFIAYSQPKPHEVVGKRALMVN